MSYQQQYPPQGPYGQQQPYGQPGPYQQGPYQQGPYQQGPGPYQQGPYATGPGYGQPPPQQGYGYPPPSYQQAQPYQSGPVYTGPVYAAAAPPHQHQQHPQQQHAPHHKAAAAEHHTGKRPPSPDAAHSSGGAAETALQAAKPWNDLAWAIIFWLQLLALIIAGFICYSKYHSQFAPANDPAPGTSTSAKDNHSSDLGPLQHAFPLLAICVAVGVLQAVVWLWLMKNHGITLIWITLIFGLIVSGAVVILAVQAGNVIGVIFGALFFLLNLWYVYAVRHKIPFAAAMLDVSLRSMSMFRTAWLLPVVGMILMAGLAFLWLICAMSIVWAVDNGGSPDPKTGNPTNGAQSVRGLIFFVLALSLFWTILLVKGWVHTCVAGVQATWYFLAPHAVPAHPVWGSVKRASTTSFGSIAFGSFIVAFIRTVRFFVNLAYQNARNSNNQFAACALCCLECLIGILESIVNYVNQYAFAICAIYGKPFLASAQQAWGLMKSRGFDAVINDSLIGGVLQFAQIICGLFTGVIAALVAYYGFSSDWRPWAGVGFVVGVMLMVVITEVVESAVVALFICLADDPVRLQQTKPDAYNRIMDPLNANYPVRGGARAVPSNSDV